jgi:Flp pilus assembly protein TadG
MYRDTPACLRRLTKQISHFFRTERGATAVEFALIAPPFLATLIATLEVCIFLFGQMALQDAANQAARYFLTGQAQNAVPPWTATQVVNKVCPPVMFNCSNLFIVVQNYNTFSTASTAAPAMYSGTGAAYTQSNYTFDPGTAGDIMVVQLVYAWPVLPAPLGFNISNLPNGAIEMMGVSAFRAEPYSG